MTMLSILITHYNRPMALNKCLNVIQSLEWNIPYEIVVSDDGSKKEFISQIDEQKIDKLLLSDKNNGLTANLNKGIKACEGSYLLYCQEDAVLSPELTILLHEILEILDRKKLDMVRLRANYRFAKLISVSENIARIPKFSIKNFTVNMFQYSDNPFITTIQFFEKYGYYLENTSGPYGETEYAIRIAKSNAKIGITKKTLAHWQKNVKSVVNTQVPIKKRTGNRKLWQYARAMRQHFEWLLYTKSNRRLFTYKNHRKTQ